MLSSLLVKLESCHNALEAHKNFNLAEVLIGEYYQEIPQQLLDEKIAKSVLNALQNRDGKLLFAAIEAELERLRVIKIEMMRKTITQP